jgi:hypothetical protein
MGSLCKSGPSTTTTASTNTTTPTGLPQLQDIWNRVSSAASTPYTPYGGELVAGLNPVQQRGITNIDNAAGSATPYYDLATSYGKAGAAAINPNDISTYMSPYTQKVIDATRANFGETNAQQQSQVLGGAAKVGALGGDRVGVAQAELARQQKLAQDPVIAGMYDKSYTDAMNVLQGNRAAAGQGAFTFGSLAPSIQNSKIQGGQAQIGAGTVQQGTDQAKLSAEYQQYMQALAFPYQQAQFMASAGLPAVTAMGGTSTGNSTSQTQAAQPSILGQVAGLGLAGAGMYSMLGGGGGFGAGTPYSQPMNGSGMYTGNPAVAGFGPTYYTNRGGRVPGYASGGRTAMNRGGRARRPGFADGGFIGQVHAIRQALRGGGPVIDMHRGNDGGYYADGGEVQNDQPRGIALLRDAMNDRVINDPRKSFAWARRSTQQGREAQEISDRVFRTSPFGRYADGGEVSFDDRFGDPGPASPYGIDPMALQDSFFAQNGADPAAFRGASAPISGPIPMPQARPPMPGPIANSSPYGLPSQITNPDGGDDPIMMPPSAMNFDGAPPSGGLKRYAGDPSPAPASPFSMNATAPMPQGRTNPFGMSDTGMALLSAGLGTLASRAPNALGAIGEGGLAGVRQYAEARKSRESNELAARRLVQQATQFSQGLDVRKGTLDEQRRYHDILSEDRKGTTAERERAARERSEDRRDNAARTAYPGEGQDAEGKTVKGLYQFNPDTREYDFKAGKVIQKGAAASGAKEGQTERLVTRLQAEAKERGENLSTADAIAITKRAPNGDQATLRREALALSAAKADTTSYMRDPSKTLEKWRKQYGLGAPGAPPVAPPMAPTSSQRNSGVPPVPGARRAPDDKWYVPDPQRPGKYLLVQ